MKVRVVDYNTGHEDRYNDILTIMSLTTGRANNICLQGNQTTLYISPKEKFIVIEEA